LGVKNNPEVYPNWYRPVVDPLFEQQLSFYYPLLTHRGLHEDDLARMLVELKFPGIKPADIDKWEAKRDKAASNARINLVTTEQAASAYNTLSFYSARGSVDTDTAELIRSQPPTPELPTAQKWHDGMVAYLDNSVNYSALLLRK
jgi:hypothetical protein